MSDVFSVCTLTSAGTALIAQATAANPIVFVGTKTGTQAVSTTTELASKDLTWFDGISGVIASSSALRNVAKITVKYGNAGATSQIVKSVCLTAKLAGQSDSDAVIIAAMCDQNSEIYLPSDQSPTQIERFMFLFAVNADNTITVTYADGASIADLERFVSMHAPGDPSLGENQTILGIKTFVNDLNCGGDITLGSGHYIEADLKGCIPKPWINTFDNNSPVIPVGGIFMGRVYNQSGLTMNLTPGIAVEFKALSSDSLRIARYDVDNATWNSWDDADSKLVGWFMPLSKVSIPYGQGAKSYAPVLMMRVE